VTHEQFIQERRYLSNVLPATIEWYTQSLHWLGTESPTADDLKAFVIRMREKGLKPTTCNNRIRAVNAYQFLIKRCLRRQRRRSVIGTLLMTRPQLVQRETRIITPVSFTVLLVMMRRLPQEQKTRKLRS